MLNITDSRTLRTTSTHQTLFNDLAPILTEKWDTVTVDYDTTTPTNVTAIHLSEEVYLALASGGNSMEFHHDSLGFTYTKQVIGNSCYKIVETDDAVMIIEYASGYWNVCTAIGETSNPTDETTSIGVATMSNATSVISYTDGLYAPSNNSVTQAQAAFSTAPQYNEQFVQFVPWYNKDLFPDVYWVTARKSTTQGETVLNGTNYFYICGILAMKYTP